MAGTAVISNGLLEPGDDWALRDQIRAQDSNHRLNIGLGDILATVGNEVGAR
jgi:hypothetical protein